MPAVASEDVQSKILEFLDDIGIPVKLGSVDKDTFLPGIDVVDGALLVDSDEVKYPGDLLHEAGHLAVTPAADRNYLTGEVHTPNAVPELVELEAILWSYAAAIHLDLDPRVVFHEHGYHGRSEGLLMNFSFGVFPGLAGLERRGMTLSPAIAASVSGEPFPKMRKWLND